MWKTKRCPTTPVLALTLSRTRQRHGTLTNLSLHMETHVVSDIPYRSTARDRVCHCVLYLADEGVAAISEDVVGDSSAPQERSTPWQSPRIACV